MIVVLALVASTAHADVLGIPDNAGPIPDTTLRVDGGVGYQFGVFEAGATGDFMFGGESTVALRYDRLALVARGSIEDLEPTNGDKYAPADGYMLRGGGDIRWSLWRDRTVATSKRGKPVQIVRADFWVGAGLGREHVVWHRGAPTDRTDLALVLGISSSMRVGPEHGAHAVFDIALELDTARPPLDRVDPGHSAHDHSALVTFALAFGN